MAQSMDGAIKDYVRALTNELKQAAFNAVVVEELTDVSNRSQLLIAMGDITGRLELTLVVIGSRRTAIDCAILCRTISEVTALDQQRRINEWTPAKYDGLNIEISTTVDISTTKPVKE